MSGKASQANDRDLLSLSEEQILEYLLTSAKPHWEVLAGHPAFSEKWVVYFLKRTRPVPQEAIQEIYRSTAFRKNYRIRLGLLCCRTTPTALSMSLVNLIRWVDLFKTLRIPNLPGALKKKIEDQLLIVLPKLALGEKITLARQAPRPLIRHLRLMPEPAVIQALLDNYFFTYEDALFLANFPKITPPVLGVLATSPRWLTFREIRNALLRNPRTPSSAIPGLAKSLSEHDLRLTLRDPRITAFARRIIQQNLGVRYQQLGKQEAKHTKKKGANRS